MASLTLRRITRDHGPLRVLHGIDLDVPEGAFVVLVGPSGCGKTTLLRIIAGLDQPSGGDVLLDGVRVNDLSAAQRGLAMVFQSYALYPHMTVRQNLAFGLQNQRMPRAEIDRRITEAARMLQIEPLLQRRPGQLSGGQRQRVAIGRTVTREPGIFLFDEPLSNLDAELRVQMRVELSDLHRRLGATMIYVTHDQTEAMTMADRIVVLRAGRVAQAGAPLDLYNHPANRFVAGFIGSPRMNFLPARLGPGGTVQPDGLAAIAATVHGTVDQAVTLGVRPEHLLIGAEGWPARIDLIEHMGGESFLHATLPNQARLVVRQAGQTTLHLGDHVAITPSVPHVFAADGDEPSLPPGAPA